jgi:phage terminase large subunit
VQRTISALAVISIPNDWRPRPHQRKLWRYLEQGGLRAAAVWHRRAGKDSLAINWTAADAMQKPGVYWHMLPEAAQGKKVIWDAIDRQGRRVIDQAFPKAIRRSTNNTEMKIELLSGSIWQVVGSDNYNSLIGANPRGITFSEYSVAKPSAWDYMRPILRENGGWALFIYTPRGRNHGYRLFETAKKSARWFSEILTVDDTGILDPATIDEERAEGMDESMIEQEYYCSFEGAMVGSYYGTLMHQLQRQGRIGSVPYDPALKVHTFWDLGYSDDTAVWFAQITRGRLRIIDCYHAHGQPIEHYIQMLKDRGYNYAEWLWMPHDARAKTLAANGRSAEEQFKSGGFRSRIVPGLSIQDGIQAARVTLPLCEFDEKKCKDGIEALRQYQREWSEDLRMFKDHPKHDWSSHYADAFRMMACAWRVEMAPKEPEKPKFDLDQTFNEIRDAAARRRRAELEDA